MLTLSRQRFTLALASLPRMQLFAAPPPDVTGLVQEILEEFYTDGIEQVVSVQLEGDTITGEFIDRVGARQIKRYKYKITDGDVAFKLLNPNEVQNFSFESFKPMFGKGSGAGKKKSCRKGTPCGDACIQADKTCRKKPGSATKAKIAEVMERLGGKEIGPLEKTLTGADAAIADEIGMAIALESLAQHPDLKSTSTALGHSGLNLARGFSGNDTGKIVLEQMRGAKAWISGVKVEGDWENPRLTTDADFYDASESDLSRKGNGIKRYKTERFKDGVYLASSTWRSMQEQRVYIQIKDKRILNFSEDAKEAKEWLDETAIQKLKAASSKTSEYPKLGGSEKQISWANQIRLKALTKEKDPKKIEALLKQTEARYWIDNRSSLGW